MHVGDTGSTGGPLAGVKVVELAGIGPSPFAALLLAELGADVIRVDRPSVATDSVDLTGGLGRSRPSIAVDLKSDAGRDVVLRLVEQADILIEGMRPGVTERLGLGPDACLARNPQLVYGRMTGWGQSGPWASMAGHDINYAALSGALHLVGPAERPMAPVNLLADFGGGTMYLLVGILAALQSRRSTGRGQVVDAAMVDGAASLVTMMYAMYGAGSWRDERGVNLLDGGAPFYDTYECADGKFVSVGAIEPQFFAQLLTGLGLEELAGQQYDTTQWPEHRRVIAERLRTRTRDEWAAAFEGTDACVAPVLSLAEAPHHPHLQARGIFADVAGAAQPRVAPRFSETPGREPTPERAPGADTRTALAAWGWREGELEELITSGAVTQRSDIEHRL
ncbi:putative fatty acid-CoA racemase [Janibacter sp. HTCC2649]|uniref:CaiB/BaiF CoA transferase family protein n=1 Tax=Janibacter sp. HTCC2649 TaxID=313589 RepID=UPI0000670BFA|nr:CaiB/BaiF CoA-transferase family protein [Janibacter sp. HTCC2649]EAQ00632.1 putative fatty acid-CoA racemase [Janibacter sp. HTCC2649]